MSNIVTAYTTIFRVRSEIGMKPVREWKEDIGDGDASETVFELGYAGQDKKHWVVSRDQAGSVAEADVDVYLDDVIQTSGFTLDEEEGTITFSSAPGDGVAVTCTYWHSLISDDEIEDQCIPWAIDYIDTRTNQSYYTSGDTLDTYTDTWDGDGVSSSFRLSRGRISSVSSYDVDGTTSGLTEDEDYYLYPHKHRIVFETPPTNDNKNVEITYSYGVLIDENIKELATILASIKAISLAIGRTGLTGAATGTGAKRGYKDSNRWVTQTKILQERAEYIFKFIGYKVKVDGVL